MAEVDTRKKTLVLEIELPTFYADDIMDAIEYIPEECRAAEHEEILGTIGEVYYGLLTIEIAGEKDSELIRTPVLMRGARIEDRPPTPGENYSEALEHFTEKVNDRLRAYREWVDG